MADNNFENIKETFDYITEALDSMRAQSAMNAGSVDKVLGNINNRLEKLSGEEKTDVVKVFVDELKKNMDEKHNFVASKFSEIEGLFKDLEQKSQDQLQKSEIREVFESIFANLSIFAGDFASQKDLITQMALRLEELKQDDSQKKDIMRNISVLKVELEKFGNGFESIILNLNDKFKELSQYLTKTDSTEALDGLKKDIESVFLSANAILSTLQVIDRKNRDLEEVITHLVTKEDFILERDQVAKLILQNVQIADYMNGLPTQSQMETLTEKIDTSIGIINALKNVLNESGKQNQQLLTAQLDNLESKILNISTEEEFIGFRKELAAFSDQVVQSTNLTRMELENTNLGIKSLYEFLNSMDIKNSFLNFTKISRASEEAIRGAVYSSTDTVTEALDKTKGFIKDDIDNGVTRVNAKIDSTKKELEENSKNNLATIAEHFQSVINNIFSFKNSLNIEQKEHVETISAQFQELKDEMTSSNNFIVQSAHENLENILSNVEKVFSEISSIKGSVSENSSLAVKNIDDNFVLISGKINEIKEDFSQNSKESFSNLLAIVEDFSQEVAKIKNSLQQSSEENSEEIKSFIESLSEKLISLQEKLTNTSFKNASEIKAMIEGVSQSVSDLSTNFTQTSNSNFINLNTNIEELSDAIKEVQNNLESRSQTNLSKICSLFEDLTREFNTHKEFLSESAQVNFETLSLCIQNLNKKIDETKSDYDETLKSTFVDVKDSVEAVGEKIQELVKGVISKDNPFKGEVLFEFSEIKSSLEKLQNSLGSTGIELSQNVDSTLTDMVQKLDGIMSEFDEKNNTALLSLQNKVSGYFENINQTVQESELKLENSLKDTSDIKSDIKYIMQNVSEMNYDSTLSEMSADLLEKLDGLLLNISQMEEKIETGRSEALQSVLITLDRKFENISSDLKSHKSFTSGTVQEFLEDLETKTENLKNHINLVGTDVVNVLSAKTDETASMLSSILQALNEFSSINFEETLSDLKEKLDSSYYAIQSAVKDNIKEENSTQLQSILKEFDEVQNKLDSAQESYNLSIRSMVSDVIEGVMEVSREKVFEKLDISEEKILEAQEENKAAIISKLIDSQQILKSDILDEIMDVYKDEKTTIVNKLMESQDDIKSAFIQHLDGLQDSLKSAVVFKLIETQDNLKSGLVEEIVDSQNQSQTTIIEKILNSQQELEEALLEKLDGREEIKEEIIEKINDSQEYLKTALFEKLDSDAQADSGVLDKIFDAQEALKDDLSGIIAKKLSGREEIKEEILEKIAQSHEELKEALLEKLVSGTDTDSDILEKLLDAQEALKIELAEKITENGEELKTVVLDELHENIKVIKEALYSAGDKGDVGEEIKVKIEKLQEDLQSISEEIESQISQNDEANKKSAQTLLSEVKTSFYEKVDDSMDELKSFIEVLEEKSDFNKTLEDLKAEVFDKFSEMAADINCSVSSIDLDKQLQVLNKDMEALVSDLFADVEEKFQSVLEGSQSFDDILSKSDEVSKRVEELKTIITEDITEKLANFELSIDTQNKDFAGLMEELKNSFNDFKENYADLSLNSVMELSGSLVNVQEQIEKVQEKLDSINLSEQIGILESRFEAVENKLSGLSFDEKFNEIQEGINNLDFNTIVESSKGEILNEFEAINQKLDLLAVSSDSESNLEDDIKEIKEILDSQKNFFEKYESEKIEAKPEETESFEDAKNQIQDVLKDFEAKLEVLVENINFPTTTVKEENPFAAISETTTDEIPDFTPVSEQKVGIASDVVGDVKEELNALKSDLLESVVEIFSQISFVAETEDIKDFVDEKVEEAKKEIISKIGKIDLSDSSVEVNIDTQELKDGIKEALNTNFEDILSSLDLLHEKATNTENGIQSVRKSLDDDTEYTYTLQDVESDIAKIRMILKEKLESKTDVEVSGLDRLAEDITSLSTRTNKLLLNSDESYNALASNLVEFKTVIYQLEEKIKHLDNTEISAKLDKINGLVMSGVQSDKIFNQTFMYLAEWIDKADNQMAAISQNMVKTTDMEKLLDKFTKKFDKQEEKIKALEAKIDKLSKAKPAKETDLKTLVQEVLGKTPAGKADTKLIKKVEGIDKQLVTLGKSIEKITSYVD